MIIYSAFDASQFFPTSEECQERYMELDDYSIPDDIELKGWGGLSPTSFKKGRAASNKGKPNPEHAQRTKERWAQWRKDNPDYKSKWKKYEPIGRENWQIKDNISSLNNTILECPYCGKTGNVGNMKRWHFDNCGKVRKLNKDAKGRFT